MIKKGLIHVLYIKYALSVRSFVCLSVCLSVYLSVSQSVGPSIDTLVGSPAGPSIGWMHRCLPVRLVFHTTRHLEMG